jgi:hypothetical protein
MSPEIKDRKKENAETLSRLIANPRVSRIRIASPGDCNAGLRVQGVYDKDSVPELPISGCSREGGCICKYEPVLNDVYP